MYNPSSDELLRNRVSADVAAASDGMAFYRKRGCPVRPDGLQGPDRHLPALRHVRGARGLAVRRASREEIEKQALEQGMRTLWDDGLAKVMSGVTSLEELGRVLV